MNFHYELVDFVHLECPICSIDGMLSLWCSSTVSGSICRRYLQNNVLKKKGLFISRKRLVQELHITVAPSPYKPMLELVRPQRDSKHDIKIR